MSDPLRKRVQGEPFVPSAKRENLISDAVRTVQTMNRPGPIREGNERSPGYVYVRNDTAAALETEHPVVGLGDVAITPSDRAAVVFDRPVFAGEVPTADHGSKFAILSGPAKTNEVIRAVVAGIAWVRLQLTDESHGFAELEVGETEFLVSAESGPAEILWAEGASGSSSEGSSSDGLVWAIVRLGGGGGSGLRIVEGFLNTPLTAPTDPIEDPTTALLDVYEKVGGVYQFVSQVTVTNRDVTLTGEEGAFCQARTQDDEWRPIWVGCSSSGSSS